MTTNSPNLPNFKHIEVSTKTIIVMTNLIIDIKNLFDAIPLTSYPNFEKKSNHNHLAPGSIIGCNIENKSRGVLTKKKKPSKKNSNWFLNSCTVIIYAPSKLLNVKICRNGMLQMTGIKDWKQADACVRYIWEMLRKLSACFTFSRKACLEGLAPMYDGVLEALFIPAMRNIDFSLGFIVDREKLANYIYSQTEFNAFLEPSLGYTGVNVKMPLTKNISELVLKKKIYLPSGEILYSTVPYQEYLKLLSVKEQEKKTNKQRFNTFLIFNSGKIILSGVSSKFMKDSYNDFYRMIQTCKHEIEERLDV